MKIGDLEKRIIAIEERNQRVEADKAWEVSVLRKLLIAIFTYIIVGIYMWWIGMNDWMLNAIIPTTGFLLSTLTLSIFKNYWIKNIYKG